ncbi:hypothetical protein ACFYOF_20295 [Streptomyces sp. NPDC007148]
MTNTLILFAMAVCFVLLAASVVAARIETAPPAQPDDGGDGL